MSCNVLYWLSLHVFSFTLKTNIVFKLVIIISLIRAKNFIFVCKRQTFEIFLISDLCLKIISVTQIFRPTSFFLVFEANPPLCLLLSSTCFSLFFYYLILAIVIVISMEQSIRNELFTFHPNYRILDRFQLYYFIIFNFTRQTVIGLIVDLHLSFTTALIDRAYYILRRIVNFLIRAHGAHTVILHMLMIKDFV